MKRTKELSTSDVETTPIKPPKLVQNKRKTTPKPLSNNTINQNNDNLIEAVDFNTIPKQKDSVEKKKEPKKINQVDGKPKITKKKSVKKKVDIAKTTSILNKVVDPNVNKPTPLLKLTPSLQKISEIEKPVKLVATEKIHSKVLNSIENKSVEIQKPKITPQNKFKKHNDKSKLEKNKKINNRDLQTPAKVEIKPRIISQSNSNELPVLIDSEEVNKIRLQEIEQRYGGEHIQKKHKKLLSKAIKEDKVTEVNSNKLIELKPIIQDKHIVLPNEQTIVDNQEKTNELESPKLSYWQQRRLQKKLKQKLYKESENTETNVNVSSESNVVTIIDSKESDSSTTNDVLSTTKVKLTHIGNDEYNPTDSYDSSTESEPPVLSYWQQRRLNKKVKLLQLRDQQNTEIATADSSFKETHNIPQETKPEIIELKSKSITKPTIESKTGNDLQVVKEELSVESETTTTEETPKLSYWQQRRLQRKQKKQLQIQDVVPTIEDISVKIKPESPVEVLKEPIISNIEEGQILNEVQTKPQDTIDQESRKLSYWQQKRLQKKLKQQQELELKLTTPSADSVDHVELTADIVVSPKRILPFPPEKAIPKKQHNILPINIKDDAPDTSKIQAFDTQDKVLVTKEKKILPVPPDKLKQPKTNKTSEIAVKILLPVPADKILPTLAEKAQLINEKKILPVPAHKILPLQEKRILPVYEKIDLTKIDSQHIKSLKKTQKPQFPKRPKPPLPILPEQLLPLIQQVDNFLINELNVHSDSTILLGVSGGVDSIAMLDIMAYISLEHNFSIHIAHCNHQLRGNESMEDEKLVRKTATQYGFHFHHTLLKVEEFASKHKVSIEHAARTLRYQFFEKMAKTTQADLVATAHTSDDSAETFLLNLLRGTGLTGLAGIPARRELTRKVHIIRPMLPLSKEDLIHYATIRKLHWREDASNSSLMYKRNKIRLKLLPTLKEQFSPAIIDILNRTSRLIQGADKLITEKVEKLIPKLIRSLDKSTVAVSIPYFDSVDDFLKGEIIQKILIDKFQSQTVSMNTIDRVIALSQSPIGAICEVTPSITSFRDRNEIVIQRKESSKEINYTIGKFSELRTEQFELKLKEILRKDVQFTEDPNREFFDADLLPLWLTMRNWNHGDRIQPLGMSGSMTVGDYLTNQKISFIEKNRCLVLCAGSEVVWICSLRASDKFKVTSTTKRVISAEFIPISTQKH